MMSLRCWRNRALMRALEAVMPLPEEIIQKKRDGGTLSARDIEDIITGLTNDDVSEGQAAAFAMAVFFNGMNRDETVALTQAMTASGTQLAWGGLDGPVLDKHSTGGIGDKVSLILAPIIAALGGYVPMISGRGLGHTGGTLDKLDSIPGYNTTPDLEGFRKAVREAGSAIVGQTSDLAPADGKLYAIRDVTATVDVPSLIVASILSKKLAAGLNGLVMDVKTGSGAFMTKIDDAQKLADELVTVANAAGLPCRALLTDMNQCLGHTAGNALEVAEAIDVLTGQDADPRLKTVTLELAAELIELADMAKTRQEAKSMAEQALDDGRAAVSFQRMVTALGGPNGLLDKPSHYLPKARIKRPVLLKESGYISKIDTRALGLAIIQLGGGRKTPEDKIDHSVGLSEVLGIGNQVDVQKPFAYIHAASDDTMDQAIAQIQQAVSVTETPVSAPPVVPDR